MKKEYMKSFVWGIAVGMAVLLIVVFSTGWMVTSGSARNKAEQIAKKAVVDNLAPICVAQFLQDPNRKERLEELKEMKFWQRGDYVKKSGWATMPGSESPNHEVAEECARRLPELKK